MERVAYPETAVYFDVCLARLGVTLLTDEVAILRASVREVRRKRPFGIGAWVVLPDRMCAIWHVPRSDPNYGQRWGAIKARFSRDLRRAGRAPDWAFAEPGPKGEVGIWQRRFSDHVIRGSGDYDDHLRRCLGSPVRMGLVARPEDWAFSSIHRDMREGRKRACGVDGVRQRSVPPGDPVTR
ncbi:REP-associated tyrosine transposase [Litorisediminicola beolgyonensis]|uniref:Transposase n=1 Tax=Litorisediminicola beolgyonensis TaxID=1173614 RepID=A0ABW3ZMV5_9RHOB